MIQFEKEFDAEDIYSRISELEDEVPEKSILNLKCIGIKGATVLFVYNATNLDSPATKFGRYCISSSAVTLLYTHSDIIDVLVGSLNEEMNLLVFARRKHSKSSTYNSYLVELNNMKVFDLGIENPYTQCLLFFPWNFEKHHGNRKEHLIFFQQKQKLGIIHVTTSLNKSDKVEVQQIQPEYLVQQYIWFQLDIPSMRLYFIYLHQKSSDGDAKSPTSMFNVYQFSTRSNPEIIMSVSLPLPLHRRLYATSKRFMVGPTSAFLPDHRVTVTVLSSVQCDTECLVLCVAYNTSYYVYVVHAGFLVECDHGELTDSTQSVVFVDVEGYVLVYSPPTVLHLIDVSAEHDGRKHMVLEDIPFPPPLTPDHDFCQHPGKVMPLCPLSLHPDTRSIMVMQQTIYKVGISSDGLLTVLRSVQCPATWSFLLHFATSHLKDMTVSHKMLLHCLQSSPSLCHREVVKEFILQSTHTKLGQQFQEGITAGILNTIPYLVEESKIPASTRNKILKVSNILQTVTKPMVSSQKFQVIVSHVGHFIRFHLESMVTKCRPSSSNGTSTTSSPSQGLHSAHSSTDDMSSTLSSPAESEDESETLYNALQYHIRRRFEEEVALKTCHDSARLYFSLLAHQGHVVMSLILISKGKPPNWLPSSQDLLSEAESGLKGLFSLLDLYKLAMLQLGNAFPVNFDWLHFYSGYKTLSREVFLRRISDKSIKLSSSTVKKFLSSAMDTDPMCAALVSALPRSAALNALNGWNSAKYRQFTAQNYLVAVKKKVGLGGPVETENETPTYLRSHPFIPINSFYSYLYHKIPPGLDVSRKLQVLNEQSMEKTRNTESDDTLRGVTFY